jgi:hypothetical protein
MLVLSKTYSSITIGLIKLVRVEYVLGRQIESIHYLQYVRFGWIGL